MMSSIGGQWQLAAQNKRKEKARIAARARRSQEANLIMDMASELRLTQEKMRRIDKSTIIKMAIDYLKAFDILCRSQPPPPTTTTITTTATIPTSNLIANTTTTPKTTTTTTTTVKLPTTTLSADPIITSTITNRIHNINSNNKIQQQKQTILTQRRQSQLDNQQHQQISHLEINQDQEKLNPQLHEHSNNDQHQMDDISPFAAPILTTSLIFAPKTSENDNKHFLMIEKEKSKEKVKFVLKPDTEISDEDDLTHLAPQAGDVSILLDVRACQAPIPIAQENLLNCTN